MASDRQPTQNSIPTPKPSEKSKWTKTMMRSWYQSKDPQEAVWMEMMHLLNLGWLKNHIWSIILIASGWNMWNCLSFRVLGWGWCIDLYIIGCQLKRLKIYWIFQWRKAGMSQKKSWDGKPDIWAWDKPGKNSYNTPSTSAKSNPLS